MKYTYSHFKCVDRDTLVGSLLIKGYFLFFIFVLLIKIYY